jgi:hypothetical protein
MRTTIKIITGTVALAVLTFAVGNAQAQITNVITLTATSQSQQSSSDNGTTTTTPAPNKTSITTKLLLGFLAQDEYAEGHYGAATFPAGAKLVVIDSTNSGGVFQVLTSSGAFLVDVSDIILAKDGHFGNDITSGKQNDATGVASTTTTDLHVLTIGYDDSTNAIAPVGGLVGLQFYLTGLMTSTTTDTKPTSAKVYTETHTSKMAASAGEGIYQGQPFVITGSLSATGKSTLTLP